MALLLVKNIASTGKVSSVELSPDERLLAVVCNRFLKEVYVFDTRSAKLKWSAGVHSHQAVFSPHGERLAVSDYAKYCVKIFASETGDLLRTLSGHTSHVWGVAWSSTAIIASVSENCAARLWNPDNGKCLRTLAHHSNSVYSVSFSPDATQLVSAGGNHRVRVWDVASGTCLRILNDHKHYVWRVAFSPDGSKLASTSYDGTVRIWDTTSDFKCIQILAGAGGGDNPTIAWSPDSRTLASANGTALQLWDESGESILQEQNRATAATFSRFSDHIITGSQDGHVTRWIPIPFTFGKLHLLSQSPDDVLGTLERVSTIIERMDPPVAFREQIKLLHELKNPSFVDMQARARVACDLEQCLPKLIDQRQSLNDAQTSLRQKACDRQPVCEAKEDLAKLESASRFVSRMKERFKEYNQLQDYPPQEDTSFRQPEHSSPRDLPEKELKDIVVFSHMSHAKLEGLKRAVIDTGKQFEKALLDYDLYSAEIREQSENNIEIITAFLAYQPSTSISSERIKEIEKMVSEWQVMLDNDADIMSKLDRSLAELSSAKDQLHKSLEEQRSRKEQIEMQAALESNARDSQAKGGRWMQRLKGGFGKSSSAGKESTEDPHHRSQQLPPPIDVDNNSDHSRQQLEQAKSNLKSLMAGIEEHAYLVYKWLQEHPDAKLDAAEVFDIIDVR